MENRGGGKLLSQTHDPSSKLLKHLSREEGVY